MTYCKSWITNERCLPPPIRRARGSWPRLRDAGWVAEAREGTRHYFSVNPVTALALRNHFETMWQLAMRAYAEHVNREESRREPSRRERPHVRRKPRR